MTREETTQTIQDLENLKLDLAHDLLAGRATDWAHYQRLVGKGTGLDEAIGVLEGNLSDEESDEESTRD